MYLVSILLKLKHSTKKNLFHHILENYQDDNKLIYIYGSDYPTKDKTSIKGYIHVMDLCNILNLIIINETTTNFTDLNVGMGFGISDLEMIQIATLTLGKKFKYTRKKKNGMKKNFL